MVAALRGWSAAQKRVLLASFLGWTLDAFDYFLLVFVLRDVARQFGVERATVAWALTLTLALRPLGALVFGRLADRFGRRPVLMLDVALYSTLGFCTAFTPGLVPFLVVRALFGIAMGGEWGIGASLTMETVPTAARGLVSGILQSGYPCGYLLASIVYATFYDLVGWRGLFMFGLLPALLVFYIRRRVPESPGWDRQRGLSQSGWSLLRRHWRLALYAVALMTAFNFFSHGTQDVYPTFLQVQHGFDAHLTGLVAVIYNIGAMLGGLSFGIASQRIGRRRAIIAAALFALPVTGLWAYSGGVVPLATGAFLMQFCVQGAWGVVPAHLVELSPPAARAAFPGTVYQLGNLIAASNAVLQTRIAERHANDYGLALASVAIGAGLVIAVLAAMGREAREVAMA